MVGLNTSRKLSCGVVLSLLAVLLSSRGSCARPTEDNLKATAGFTPPRFTTPTFRFKYNFLRVSNPLVFYAKCNKSSINGFTSSKQLTNGLTLHWQAISPTGMLLQLAVEAKKGTPAAASWFAVGWSTDGKMDGSNVLVMKDSGIAPAEYDLTSDVITTAKAVAATWTPSGSYVTEDSNSIVMQFSRAVDDPGNVGVQRKGFSNIIWAYGAGIWEADGSHDARGATVVDFSCDGCKGMIRRRC